MAAVPVLGNLSSGLAWTLGLLGAVWLVACAGAGRRALLPALAPVAAATLAWPAYLVVAGRTRGAPGRARSPAPPGPSRPPCGTPGPAAAAPLAGSSDVLEVARQLATAARRAARCPGRRVGRRGRALWPLRAAARAALPRHRRWPSGWAS